MSDQTDPQKGDKPAKPTPQPSKDTDPDPDVTAPEIEYTINTFDPDQEEAESLPTRKH